MPFVPMMAVMGVPFLAACRLSAGRLPLDPDDAGLGGVADGAACCLSGGRLPLDPDDGGLGGVADGAACCLSGGRLPLDPDDAGGGGVAVCSDDGGHVGSAGGRLSSRLLIWSGCGRLLLFCWSPAVCCWMFPDVENL